MQQHKVTFTYFSEANDCEYLISANVTPASPAPPQNFDRFQEPDDPAEAEIIRVLALDDDGAGYESSEAVFSDAELAEIEAKAIEEYYDEKDGDFENDLF